MNNNFMQIVPQTYDERVAMYMKCTKKQLIEMLIESNRLLLGGESNIQFISQEQFKKIVEV